MSQVATGEGKTHGKNGKTGKWTVYMYDTFWFDEDFFVWSLDASVELSQY